MVGRRAFTACAGDTGALVVAAAAQWHQGGGNLSDQLMSGPGQDTALFSAPRGSHQALLSRFINVSNVSPTLTSAHKQDAAAAAQGDGGASAQACTAMRHSEHECWVQGALTAVLGRTWGLQGQRHLTGGLLHTRKTINEPGEAGDGVTAALQQGQC